MSALGSIAGEVVLADRTATHHKESTTQTNRIRFFAAATATAVVFLLLATGSALTKRPWGDEAWIANPALDLLTRGSAGASVMEPTGNAIAPGKVLLRINQHVYLIMPLGYLAMAGWFRVFGFGILQMRSLSMAWGLLALACCFLIVKKLSGNPVLSLLATLLLAVDRAFIDAASDGRPDMMSGALGLASLASYVGLRERSLPAAVLVSQSLLAAALFTHPISGVAAFGVLVLAISLDRRRLRLRHLGLAAIPYLIAGAGWTLYILRDPEAFRAQFSANATGRLSGLLSPLSAILLEIKIKYLEGYYLPPYATGLRRLTVVIPLMYAVGALALTSTRAIRRQTGYRILLALTIVYFFVLAIFDGHKNYYYLVHIIPLWAITLALFFYWYWTSRLVPRWLLASLLAGFLCVQLGWTAYSITRDPYRKNYLPAVAFLKQRLSPTSLVFGPPEFGFALGFYDNLIDDSSLGYWTGKKAAFIILDERGYKESFKEYERRFPQLHRYLTILLNEEYTKVYKGPFYEIYARR